MKKYYLLLFTLLLTIPAVYSGYYISDAKICLSAPYFNYNTNTITCSQPTSTNQDTTLYNAYMVTVTSEDAAYSSIYDSRLTSMSPFNDGSASYSTYTTSIWNEELSSTSPGTGGVYSYYTSGWYMPFGPRPQLPKEYTGNNPSVKASFEPYLYNTGYSTLEELTFTQIGVSQTGDSYSPSNKVYLPYPTKMTQRCMYCGVPDATAMAYNYLTSNLPTISQREAIASSVCYAGNKWCEDTYHYGSNRGGDLTRLSTYINSNTHCSVGAVSMSVASIKTLLQQKIPVIVMLKHSYTDSWTSSGGAGGPYTTNFPQPHLVLGYDSSSNYFITYDSLYGSIYYSEATFTNDYSYYAGTYGAVALSGCTNAAAQILTFYDGVYPGGTSAANPVAITKGSSDAYFSNKNSTRYNANDAFCSWEWNGTSTTAPNYGKGYGVVINATCGTKYQMDTSSATGVQFAWTTVCGKGGCDSEKVYYQISEPCSALAFQGISTVPFQNTFYNNTNATFIVSFDNSCTKTINISFYADGVNFTESKTSTGTQLNFTHNYTTTGSYNVKFFMYEMVGGVTINQTITFAISIIPVPVLCNFTIYNYTATPTSLKIGEAINFTADVYNPCAHNYTAGIDFNSDIVLETESAINGQINHSWIFYLNASTIGNVTPRFSINDITDGAYSTYNTTPVTVTCASLGDLCSENTDCCGATLVCSNASVCATPPGDCSLSNLTLTITPSTIQYYPAIGTTGDVRYAVTFNNPCGKTVTYKVDVNGDGTYEKSTTDINGVNGFGNVTYAYTAAATYNIQAIVTEVTNVTNTLYTSTSYIVTQGGTAQNGSSTCKLSDQACTNTLECCPSLYCTSNNVCKYETGFYELNIPEHLVDPENPNEGLIPEIYYGSLKTFSRIGMPFIFLIFTIILVLIILALIGFIKRVAEGS